MTAKRPKPPGNRFNKNDLMNAAKQANALLNQEEKEKSEIDSSLLEKKQLEKTDESKQVEAIETKTIDEDDENEKIFIKKKDANDDELRYVWSIKISEETSNRLSILKMTSQFKGMSKQKILEHAFNSFYEKKKIQEIVRTFKF